MTKLEKLYSPKLYSQPALVQSYQPYFSGGIGDFLGGAIQLRRLCAENGIPFYLDFKHHPLGFHLSNSNESPYCYRPVEVILIDELCGTDYSKMEKTLLGLVKSCVEPTFVASFFFKGIHEKLTDPAQLSKEKMEIRLQREERTFFQEALRFNSDIESRYESFLKTHQLSEKNYDLAHFRLGDRELLKNQSLGPEVLGCLDEFEIDYSDYSHRAQNLQKSLESSLVVLSDSNDFKDFLRQASPTQIFPSPTVSAHSVHRPGLLRLTSTLNSTKEDRSCDLALDMRLIQGARSVTSFSNHFWGSGMSFWLCKIFNVPLVSFQTGKLICKGEADRKVDLV